MRDRRDAENAGIHFNPRRNPEHRHRLADDRANIPRGAVAAAKQHQIDAGGQEFPGRNAGIVRRRRFRRRMHHVDIRKGGSPQRIEPHLAGDRQPVNRLRLRRAGHQAEEFQQHFPCAPIGYRHGPASHCFVHDAVAALQPDAAAHSGDRIDDESYPHEMSLNWQAIACSSARPTFAQSSGSSCVICGATK